MGNDPAKDPRDIYYVCVGCGRTAIAFDKPFPEYCAECRAVDLLDGSLHSCIRIQMCRGEAFGHKRCYCDELEAQLKSSPIASEC